MSISERDKVDLYFNFAHCFRALSFTERSNYFDLNRQLFILFELLFSDEVSYLGLSKSNTLVIPINLLARVRCIQLDLYSIIYRSESSFFSIPLEFLGVMLIIVVHFNCHCSSFLNVLICKCYLYYVKSKVLDLCTR